MIAVCYRYLTHSAGLIHGHARLVTGARDFAGQLAYFKAVRCESIYREWISDSVAGTLVQRLTAMLSHKGIVAPLAADRLSRDTTDLPAIAPDDQRLAQARVRALSRTP